MKERDSAIKRNGKRVVLWLMLSIAIAAVIVCGRNKPKFRARQRADAKNFRPSTPQPGRNFLLNLGGAHIELIWINGGTFEMGSPTSDTRRDISEEPVHTVELNGFWLGETEVTQAQYEAIMEANPSKFRGADRPVESISWNEAMDFCRHLSRKMNTPNVSYTLPTEAQWEYACRADTTTRYSFGDSEGGLDSYAWYFHNSLSQTHPVKGKRPNPWGLYDMHGNAWEWCLDWYDDYSSDWEKNPVEEPNDSGHILRGGSWDDEPPNCRSANRHRDDPLFRSYTYGFRVAAVLTH